jgi:hypothetical protein
MLVCPESISKLKMEFRFLFPFRVIFVDFAYPRFWVSCVSIVGRVKLFDDYWSAWLD